MILSALKALKYMQTQIKIFFVPTNLTHVIIACLPEDW